MSLRGTAVSLTFALVATSIASMGCEASSSSSGPAREGDPCGSSPVPPASQYEAAPRAGDVLWVETPEIVHERDYYSYVDFVQPDVPIDWTSPVDFTEGQIWLSVEVLETPDGFVPPVYYTVTWGPAREGAIGGFLRAAVEIDRPGPALYEAVFDVRSTEYSPDGTCCQSVCERPWPWDAAWRDVAGDVVVLEGNGFPLRVRTRMVLRPPPG